MDVMVTVGDLSDQMHIDNSRFYEWAKRESDPLPLRTMNGMKRSSSMLVSEWAEWWRRNSTPFREVDR